MIEKVRCKSCIIPDSPVFKLNSDDKCSICANPSSFQHILIKPDNSKLNKLISEAKDRGKNHSYDCIVAWSGGRDSTYMLHELVTKHKLRCAAVFGVTPFTPQEIIDNVHRIAKKLEIKLIEVKTPTNHHKIASYCLKEYAKTKLPALVNLACASCKFVNRSIFKEAHKLNIKTVIYGGNRFEYFPSGPVSVDINTKDRYSLFSMCIDNVLRLFKGTDILLKSPKLIKYLPTFFKASILYINQYSVYLRLKYPDIIRFDYYHSADWNEQDVNQVLADLEWQLPPGCVSTWRADCVFEAVKNTAFKNRLGFTYSEAMYSNLIRAEKMTREQALHRISKENISEKRLSEALKICNLPLDILDEKVKENQSIIKS